jgi:hypothetical protein
MCVLFFFWNRSLDPYIYKILSWITPGAYISYTKSLYNLTKPEAHMIYVTVHFFLQIQAPRFYDQIDMNILCNKYKTITTQNKLRWSNFFLVPISSVTLVSMSTDTNPVEVVSSRDQKCVLVQQTQHGHQVGYSFI